MKNWISKAGVCSCFITCRMSRASFGRPLASFCFFVFFSPFRRGEDESLLLPRVCPSFSDFPPKPTRRGGGVMCLLTCLRLPADAASLRSPARPLFFSSFAAVFIMHAFLSSGGKKEKSSFLIRLPGLFRSWISWKSLQKNARCE